LSFSSIFPPLFLHLLHFNLLTFLPHSPISVRPAQLWFQGLPWGQSFLCHSGLMV
jgi:hypothetical protein